jgi:hypothetical protein
MPNYTIAPNPRGILLNWAGPAKAGRAFFVEICIAMTVEDDREARLHNRWPRKHSHSISGANNPEPHH